ncbi:uncharacterized protein LOC62_05G007710 [Vanrija pseudolonga]|uniref:Uncharacterized protein n=1 Tax=Vanrija pseudolonga TaxID=143232 RepID=A0AAF0YCI0_9TREE|nr:hypothetical protein LOC62_05G007710 [Vanrija pseudolonga]
MVSTSTSNVNTMPLRSKSPNAAVGAITSTERALTALSDRGRGGQAYTQAVLSALVLSLRARGVSDAQVDAELVQIQRAGHAAAVAEFRFGGVGLGGGAKLRSESRETLPPYSLM